MTSIRVLATVAGLSLDAVRTETAVRHALRWCQEGAVATVAFLDSHDLYLTARRLPGGLTPEALLSVDLVLPADQSAAVAMRRHGGLLAQATEPAGFARSLLAGLARHDVAVSVVGPSVGATETLAAMIRRQWPALRVPVSCTLPPMGDRSSVRGESGIGWGEDPWPTESHLPGDLMAAWSQSPTALCLLVAPGPVPPVHTAQALVRASGQVVLMIPGGALGRLLSAEDRRALGTQSRMPQGAGWLARARSALWARYLA
jgi:hypothetical protein